MLICGGGGVDWTVLEMRNKKFSDHPIASSVFWYAIGRHLRGNQRQLEGDQRRLARNRRRLEIHAF